MAKLFELFIALLSIHCSCGVLPRHFDTDHGMDPPPIDPDVLQYLAQLYEKVKESGRQPVDGELNLLPDESKGFANVVRCFPDSQIASMSHTSNSVVDIKRTMRFDLHGFKPAEEIVEVRLVLKQSANAPEYTASVHEIMEDGIELKELDSHVYRGEWLDLNVHGENDETMMIQGENNNKKSYKLALKISDLNANCNRTTTLNNVKPMLLVYVYDKNMLKHGNANKTSSATKASSEEETNYTIKKRQVETEDPSLKEKRFEEMRRRSCRVYYHNTTHEELGWPQLEGILVLEPRFINYGFCYGHCKEPFVRSEAHKYTRRSKIISDVNPDLSDAGLAPCCVPTEFVPTGLLYEDDSVSTMGSFPIVAECGCR